MQRPPILTGLVAIGVLVASLMSQRVKRPRLQDERMAATGLHLEFSSAY